MNNAGYISGSRENFKNGTVRIRDITQGSWYLGFRNPSTTEGIYITFEVAAIVETPKTQKEQKAEMLANFPLDIFILIQAELLNEQITIIIDVLVNPIYKPRIRQGTF